MKSSDEYLTSLAWYGARNDTPDIDIDTDISMFLSQREARSEEEKFERETLKTFKSYNRLSYDKRYKEKHGVARKRGSDDFVIKLSLLLHGVKNDDYTVPEVIFLRDCFAKKVKKEQLLEAKRLVADINDILLAQLKIK